MRRPRTRAPTSTDALDLVVETLEAVIEERGENEPIWGSMIKQAIKRRHPGFNERAYGFRSFNDLLADAQKRGLLTLAGGREIRRLHRPGRRQGRRLADDLELGPCRPHSLDSSSDRGCKNHEFTA